MSALETDNRFGHQNGERKHFFLVSFLTGCALFFFALPNSKAVEVVNNLSFDLFSQERGLSNNQIHCILQDSNGWMWIGTSQGVCRFDFGAVGVGQALCTEAFVKAIDAFSKKGGGRVVVPRGTWFTMDMAV